MLVFIKVSFIGHSLGGMYLRFALGELYDFFSENDIRLVNFVSMATPHLGIRHFRDGLGTTIADKAVPYFAGKTGKQLMFLVMMYLFYFGS